MVCTTFIDKAAACMRAGERAFCNLKLVGGLLGEGPGEAEAAQGFGQPGAARRRGGQVCIPVRPVIACGSLSTHHLRKVTCAALQDQPDILFEAGSHPKSCTCQGGASTSLHCLCLKGIHSLQEDKQ